MNIFIKKSILMFLLLTLSLGIINLVIPDSGKSYISIINYKESLLKETPSPRMIFIGGSSMAFSLDSEMVERETGYHVINTAVHIGLGLDFMLNQVRPYLREGDVVVLVPEYELYYPFNDRETLILMLSVYPKGFFYLNPSSQ